MMLQEPIRGNSIMIAQGSHVYKYDGGLIFSEQAAAPKLAMFVDYDGEDFARVIIEDKIRYVKIEDMREVKNNVSKTK